MQKSHSKRAGGILSGMRVRKKVLILHTLFSLGLAAVPSLGLAVPAVGVASRKCSSATSPGR